MTEKRALYTTVNTRNATILGILTFKDRNARQICSTLETSEEYLVGISRARGNGMDT